jgi:acyl-CoA reductase-like NAD-dependent aldehyde dehydrogenase
MSKPGRRPRAVDNRRWDSPLGDGGLSGEEKQRQKEAMTDAIRLADERLKRQANRPNKAALRHARSELNAAVEAAVRARRLAHRDLTPEEQLDIVNAVDEELRPQAAEIVKLASADDGDRLAADRLASERAIEFAQAAKATYEPPAEDTDGRSTADILASIPRA